ncbi:hypothetical protein ACIBI3_00690 [Actinomadura luteofluorescens]|uniref:hypothetical protein n=1 Tax=Actinomadura luteofluorescens TaxID=46163 RepID=UPI00348366F4
MIKVLEIDEGAFTMPDSWHGARHPRRDRPDVPRPAAPDEAAAGRARRLVDDARDRVEEVLALPGTAPELAGAARAHLQGAPNPLPAAAVADFAGVWADGRAVKEPAPDGPSREVFQWTGVRPRNPEKHRSWSTRSTTSPRTSATRVA